MAFIRILLVSLLLGWVWPSWAFVASERPDHYNLVGQIEIFVDRAGTATSDEIISDPGRFDFKPTSLFTKVVNFGFSDATYWVKVPLSRHPDAPEKWILEIPYLGLYEVCFYAPGAPVVTSGAIAPIESRPFEYRFFAFPVTLKNETQDFYFRIRSNYAITIPLMLYSLAAFNNAQVTDTMIQALYYGGLISLLLYNLILFITVRDRQYLIYCLFTGLAGLGIFAGNGYGRLYLWPNAIEWDLVSQNALFGYSGVFAMAFTAIFLRTRTTQPRFNNLLIVAGGLYLIFGLLFTATVFNQNIPTQRVSEAFFAINLLGSFACLYGSFQAIKQGHRGAYYFALAWGSLATGSIIASFRVFELVPSNAFTLYAFQIGSGLEMMLFSFALAARIQHERLLRETAQSDALIAKQATLDALKISEDRLEDAVQKRTEKLQHLLMNEQAIHEQYVRFGAMIAHEFRNPLNIIEGQTSMLELESESGISHTQKRTSAIRTATFRLSSLFDQWLQSDRIHQQAGHLEKTLIDLGALLTELVNNSRNMHPDFQFEFVNPRNPIQIEADSHLLQIAVLNLIDNSCKYSPKGTIVTLSLVRNAQQIALSVHDQGQGIRESDQERVFDLYFRASLDDRVKGVGLGLAFVKRITELHGGHIELHSELNAGTTFTLWLPISGGKRP